MYRCPLCGATSNRRGDPFETEQQVVAHVDGSHNDDHDGVTGSEIREQIETVDTADADGQESQEDVSPSPDDQSATAPAKSVRGNDSSNVSSTSESNQTDETEQYSPNEVEDIVEGVTEHARQDGYEQGHEEAASELEQQQSETQQDGQEETVFCWKCDRKLGTVAEVRKAMSMGQTEYAGCEHCGAAVQV